MIWTSTYSKVTVAVLALGLGAVVLSEYTAHVKADAEAQATIKTQAANQKVLQDQLAVLQKEIADRDAQYQADKKAQDTKFQQATSPAQIAGLVAQFMGLKQPIQIVQPAPTAANPNPAPVAQVSTLDAPQVKTYLEECESCKLQLPKLAQDNANLQAQLGVKDNTIKSVEQQRDAAITEAKGGGVWKRTKKALKYLGIGALAGAAAVCGSGHCR